MIRSRLRLVTLSIALLSASAAAAQPASPGADATLRSTPDTVLWGYFAGDVPPVLHIKSGQTVRIDTISHGGMNGGEDPVAFFARAGIAPGDVLQDVKDIYEKVPHPKGAGGHVLTGPIYIDGAAPGDMLEVRIVALENRVPYGVNDSGPGRGVLGELLAERSSKVIKLDLARHVALFADGIELPLQPFMGIMAVAPPRDLSMTSSRPPAAWGGNLDFNKLTVGATLYLPVFNPGALFFTGDLHAVQGDGEIDGGALEASLTATLQFIVHKGAGRAMHWPRAEDASYYYTMGLDLDLDKAMHDAAQEAIAFLRDLKGLSAADAYALASVGVDFRVGEAVDTVQMVYGMIPKRLFKSNPDYWAKP